MSSSMWGYLFLFLGIMAAALLLLFGNINTKNEQDYYLIKEVTQNAMLDSVDNNAYVAGLEQHEVDHIKTISCASGKPGTIRIVTEKFIENFARRFAEVALDNQSYRIEFYDIQECPAKVTLRVISKEDSSWVRRIFRGSGTETDEVLIVNDLSAILESRE